MMKKLLVGIAFAVAACSDSSGPSGLGGRWISFDALVGGGIVTLDLTLAENNGSVLGSGTIGVDLDEYACTVVGAKSGADVGLTITAGLRPPVSLSGRIGRSQIRAVLNGSGFVNDSVHLLRR